MINWSIVLSSFLGGWLCLSALAILVFVIALWQSKKMKNKMKGAFN